MTIDHSRGEHMGPGIGDAAAIVSGGVRFQPKPLVTDEYPLRMTMEASDALLSASAQGEAFSLASSGEEALIDARFLSDHARIQFTGRRTLYMRGLVIQPDVRRVAEAHVLYPHIGKVATRTRKLFRRPPPSVKFFLSLHEKQSIE